MASKNPSTKGRFRASPFSGTTRWSTPNDFECFQVFSGPSHRSTAQTRAPNSFARNTLEIPFPQPRSRTLTSGLRSTAFVSHSVSQRTFMPMLFCRIHSGSYLLALGNAGWLKIALPRCASAASANDTPPNRPTGPNLPAPSTLESLRQQGLGFASQLSLPTVLSYYNWRANRAQYCEIQKGLTPSA